MEIKKALLPVEHAHICNQKIDPREEGLSDPELAELSPVVAGLRARVQ